MTATTRRARGSRADEHWAVEVAHRVSFKDRDAIGQMHTVLA